MMKANKDKAKLPNRHPDKAPDPIEKGDYISGYPEYPDKEDIYKKYHEESDLNPEDPTKKKDLIDFDEISDETGLDNFSGSDLDIPGSELDDDQEDIGSEDEENNYYSLGEDSHNELEENTDDEPA